MKYKKRYVYLFAIPVVLITIFWYVFFINEVGISDVIRSIQLKVYIVLGFVIAISALHFAVKRYFKEKK